MNRNLFKRIIAGLLVLIMTFATGLSYLPADAAINSVDPNSDVFNESNSLLIQKYPNIKGFSYTTNIATSRMNVYEKDVNASSNVGGGGSFFGSDFKTKHYDAYLSGYKSTCFEVKDGLKSSDYIKTTHNNVGTYNGTAVDMIVTYTGFVQRDSNHYITHAGLNSGYSYLDISANPYNGYVYGQVDHMIIEVDFIYSGTSTAIDVTGAYLSFNSLNGHTPDWNHLAHTREWVNYENTDVTTTTNAYVRNDTNLKYESASSYSAYTSYSGNAFIPQSNDFEDALGADTFTKNSVSFQLTGTTQTFTVGTIQNAIAWNTFSSALLMTAKGVEPTKKVDKDFAEAGETLTYEINQQVHTLGQDLLTKYQSFVFTDALPDEVEYMSAKLVGEDGTDYTSYGTATYDASTHTVKFTTNSDFLNNVIKYEAETYTLVITTKVKSTITETTTITNTGDVNIDGVNQTTNEVKTLVSPFPPISFNSITKSIKISSGNVNEYTLGSYAEDIIFVGTSKIQNTNDLTSVVISDTLDPNLTFKDLKITNSAGTNIASYGTRVVSGQNVTFTFATAYLSTIAGDTLTVELTANYNGNTSFADMTDNKIKNTMALNVNGTNINSNEVSINSPALKTEKSVDKSEIQVDDTVTYTIKTINTVAGTTAKNVVVYDTSLPEGFEYVSATSSGVTATVTQSGNGFVAKAASLAYGETLTVTYKVKATNAANGATTTNTVYASADNADKTSDTAKVYINTAGFAINKKVSAYEWKVGDTVDYTVEVRNTAAGTIGRNVVISDISLPEGLKIDGEIKVSDSSVTITKEGTGFKATCAELAYNKTITITFTCTATEAVNSEVVVNTATVTADNADLKEDTAEVYINTAKLTIEKVSSKDEWEVGDLVDYTVVVKNIKKGTIARNTVVSDISLPAGLAVTGDVKITGATGTVTNTSTGFKILVEELPYGDTMTITYQCKALEAVNGSEVTNKVTAVADNADTVEDDVTVYINSPELTIEKSVSQYEWKVGDTVDYTVVVKNIKNGTLARDVVISDISLPEYLTVSDSEEAITIEGAADGYSISKEGSGFVISAGEMNYNSPISEAETNETITVKFKCVVSDDANGKEIVNTATAASEKTEEIKDTARIWINSPDLNITKEADKASKTYKIGDIVTYTIKVTNDQLGTVGRNIVVTDTIETEGAKLQKNSIVLMDSEGTVISPFKSTINGNSFNLEIGTNLVNEDNYILYDGEEIEQDSQNPLGETLETSYTIEYSMVITDENLQGQEVNNLATVNSDEDIPDEDDETITIPEETPKLEVEKEADAETYYVGDSASYTISVENTKEDSLARNIVVDDTIETKGASNGVEIQEDSIVVKLNDELLSVSDMAVTIDGQSLKIETGVNLSYGDVLTVYYKALFASEDLVDVDAKNTVYISTDNAKTVKADAEVTIVPGPFEDEITKVIVGNDGSEVKSKVLSDNTEEFTFRGYAQINDSEDITLIVLADKLHNAFAYIENSLNVYDGNDNNIIKKCNVEIDGQNIKVTISEKYAAKLSGQLISWEFAASYVEGSDLSELENGAIKNTMTLTVNENEPIESNEVTVTPIPVANSIIKSIIDNDGNQVSELTLEDNTDSIPFRGIATISNTKAIESIVMEDVLNDAFVYITDSLKVYDQEGNDITEKGTISVDGQHISFTLVGDSAAAYRGQSLTWEFAVNYVEGSDLSGLENAAITNTMTLTVNEDDPIGSNEVTVTPIPLENEITKALVGADDSEVESLVLTDNSADIPYRGHVQISNTMDITSIVIGDVLHDALRYKENSFKVLDASDNDITEHGTFSVDGQELKMTFEGDYAKSLTGQQLTIEFVTNYVDGYDLSTLENGAITNIMTLTVNEELIESNEVTVTPVPVANSIVKSILDKDGNMVSERTLKDNSEVITFAGVATVANDSTINSFTITDSVSSKFIIDEESYNLVDAEGNDFTEYGSFNLSDENVLTFTANKENLQEFTGKTLYLNFNVTYNQDLDFTVDQSETNTMTLTINDESFDSNEVKVNTNLEAVDEQPADTTKDEDVSSPKTGLKNNILLFVLFGLVLLISGVIAYRKRK